MFLEYENNMHNGYQCYTCEGDDCTKKLSCVGKEDSCITASRFSFPASVSMSILSQSSFSTTFSSIAANWNDNNVTLKGCASYDLCWYLENMESGIECCYGSLCNKDRDQHQHYTDHSHHGYDYDPGHYDYDYDCHDIFCGSDKTVGQSVFLLLGSLFSILLSN